MAWWEEGKLSIPFKRRTIDIVLDNALAFCILNFKTVLINYASLVVYVYKYILYLYHTDKSILCTSVEKY